MSVSLILISRSYKYKLETKPQVAGDNKFDIPHKGGETQTA
ncbi:MAG: hypothetical protein ACJAQ2_001245, partial [Vicingaceae bacterium]